MMRPDTSNLQVSKANNILPVMAVFLVGISSVMVAGLKPMLVTLYITHLQLSTSVAGYTLGYARLTTARSSNAIEQRVQVDLSRGGGHVATIRPGKNDYTVEQQVANQVAIHTDYLTGTDVYVIADQINRDGSVFLKVLVKPLVNLIWVAGFVFVGGSLVALWPDAREERRLAARYAQPVTVKA